MFQLIQKRLPKAEKTQKIQKKVQEPLKTTNLSDNL
jgi:hypothetical protein